MEWKEYKLGDVCEITSSKRIFYSEYEDSGVPFYRSKEIINLFNKQEIATELFISEERYKEIKEKFGVPQKNDILLTSVGSIGIPYLVKENDKFYFKDGNLTWIRNYDARKIDPLFLYIWIISEVGKRTLEILSMGAAQAALTISRLKEAKIFLPSINEQRAIASILSNYDMLIDINTKRIKLLEESAGELYKEWFVRMRFPGYEKAKFVKGIPVGWDVKTIDEICDSVGGGTPSTSNANYWGGKIKWVTPTDITSKQSLPLINIEGRITEAGLRQSSTKLLPAGAILMTSRASIGFFGICKEQVCTNQGFISIIPNEENLRMYMLCNLMMRREEIISNANGATFLEISKGRFRKMEMLIPNNDVLSAFEERCSTTFDAVYNLEIQNQNLAATRDRLLPRLLSGELKVKT